MAKPGRNELCPCGSGKKYKKCHETQESGGAAQGRVLMILVGLAVAGAIVAGIAQFTGERSTSGTRVWDPAHGHYHDANGVQVP
jgi:hypothetical protein